MGDDAAVQEVIGFILMFALSSAVLIISVQSFTAAKEESADVLAAVELKAVATRISSRLVQAGVVSQEFPEARFNVTLSIPRAVAGHEYQATISPTAVTVRSLDGTLHAESTTFRIDAFTASDPKFTIRGSVYSSQGDVAIQYSRPKPDEKLIELKGVS